MGKSEQESISIERLKRLPKLPGVYLMKDKQGTVIYVGKAKNLYNRVRGYFQGRDERPQIRFLVPLIKSIDTLITEDERQALVLEGDLIKKYKPRFNVRLKDDKAPLIIRIDTSHQWPRLELVRKVKNDSARYIGPFAFSHELRTLLDVVRNSVPLRTCSDRMLINRVRPCLEYQIKRCLAPCCLEVNPSQYQDLIEQAVKILEGKDTEVLKELQAQLERASEELRFEEAANLRDRLEILNKVNREKPVADYSSGAKDVFGMYIQDSKAELAVLQVRQGRLFGAKTFGFSEVVVEEEELLSSLLAQFYTADNEIPDQIILGRELEDSDAHQSLYSEQRGKKVQLIYPKRGEKLRLLRLSQENARESFRAHFLDAGDDAAKELHARLKLEQSPRIIECIDISHFQGSETVASVVSFQDGQAAKDRYRRFNLSQTEPDDFASMREVVERHLRRAAEENTICDLLVIDGGLGQLSQALKIRDKLGLDKPEMIGLAKKRAKREMYASVDVQHKPERIYREDSNIPFILPPESAAVRLLARIRNEAHRFAISFHREKRSKKTFRSTLDSIPGVGPKRKKQLLRAFGSLAAIKTSSPEEVKKRCPMPLALAKRIIETLNKGNCSQG